MPKENFYEHSYIFTCESNSIQLRQNDRRCDRDLLPSFRTKLSMISSKERGRGMSRSKHTEAQMIGALKQLEAGRKAEDVAREVGVSKHTIYAWKAKYGGMDVSEAQEAKQLRDENTRLKKLVVDLSLDKEMLKAVIAKNGWSS
jgi:putative transposase